jgi:multidrug efflux pump subunit AcrA (membrane-fusion protein)
MFKRKKTESDLGDNSTDVKKPKSKKRKMIIAFVLVMHVLGALTSVRAVMSTRTSQGAIAWAVSLNTFPYFVPDEQLMSALQLAALRGVDVRILIPQNPDHLHVYLSGISYSGDIQGHSMIRTLLHCEMLLATVVLVGCKEAAEVPPEPPRPVSFVTLEASNPSETTRLTGSVESWKREDIGFEVAGRVLRVIEPGANIVGRSYDENGELLTEGTVIAEIDTERYEIAKRQAEAAANAAKADLEEVIPPMLAEAQAALDLANTELQRYTNLVQKQSAPQQRLDVAKTAQQAALAKVAQVEALRATKAELLNTSLATVQQAEVNIADCKLYSPFTGQVARVHVLPGGYALPGQAVVTVQMMDPMKVNIAVSAATDERINQNDLVRVYSPDGEMFEGTVYLKAIQEDDEGHFVWKVENLTRDQLFEDFDPVLKVSKVRVTIGEGRVPVLQVFTFRELTDVGGLNPDTDVIVGDISGDVDDDGKVVLVRQRWLGRPGDVVRVGLKGKETPEGFYVSEDAIQFDGTEYHVAVAERAPDGTEQVAFVSVTPHETVGSLRRIEGELEAGMNVIVEGAHYVTDGESVRTIAQVLTSD